MKAIQEGMLDFFEYFYFLFSAFLKFLYGMLEYF